MTTTYPERGFPAWILTDNCHCPGEYGISADVERVTIVGPSVPDDCRISEPSDDAPAVTLAETTPGYRVLVPVGKPDAAVVGPMASGAYVRASDSRWRSIAGDYRPLPLHDRFETCQQYRSYD